MEQDSTTTETGDIGLSPGDAWFALIEAGIRERVRGLIEVLPEQEPTAALWRDKSRAGIW